MSEIIILSDEINLGVDMNQLIAFATSMDFAIEDDWNEQTLASHLISYIDQLSEDDWNAMDPAVQSWSNSVNEQVLELKKAAASKPAKTPKVPKSTAKTAKKTQQTISGGDGSSSIGESINSLSKKADIIATATALGKTSGQSVKLIKSWSVAKLKEEAIKQLTSEPEAAASKPAKPAKPAKSASKRVSAKSNAEDPAPKTVAAAKANAKANAVAARKKSSSMIDGEPFRRNTTAWICWDVFRKAKKALTLQEATERFVAEFEKTDLKSANAAGRMPRIIQVMLHDKKIMNRNDDGTYELN